MSHDVSSVEENKALIYQVRDLKHRLEGGKGGSHVVSFKGRLFQAEGVASPKVLRWECLMSWGKSKRPMQLEWRE